MYQSISAVSIRALPGSSWAFAHGGGPIKILFVSCWSQLNQERDIVLLAIALKCSVRECFKNCYVKKRIKIKVAHVILPWSQRLSFILYWQILGRESLIFFFIGTKR